MSRAETGPSTDGGPRDPVATLGGAVSISETLRRYWDGRVVTAFVASRLLLLLASVVAEFFIPRNPALTSGDNGPILRSLTSWDGWWFLGIAREGYHATAVTGAYHDYAFLPLYPLVVGVLSFPWPAIAGLIAVLVSNVAFLAALFLLVDLGARHIGRERASLAAAWLAIWPFGSAFGMAYSDSLFLLLIVGSFLAAERDRRLVAGVLLGLACLTRLQGIALILPLWLLLARRDGWRFRPSQLWLLLGPAAAAAYFAYIAIVSGSPTAFFDAQEGWGRTGMGGAEEGTTIGANPSAYQFALVLALCWVVFLVTWQRRDRLPLPYFLIPILFIAAEISSGSLEAVGRVTMTAFPLAWFMACRKAPWVRDLWPPVSAGLFVIIAIVSFGGYWVP